jgi:hypothetical protein
MERRGTPTQGETQMTAANNNPTRKIANVGTTQVDARTGRFTVSATRYTARVGRETLMQKDGKPRAFMTRDAALKAAQNHLDALPGEQ